MFDSSLTIAIAVFLLSFATICLVVVRPISFGGQFSLRLVLINVAGWLLILPLDPRGHAPPQLIVMGIFWLANLVLLPAAAVALWTCHKDGEEKKGYVAAAAFYLAANFLILFLIPAAWLIGSAVSH